MQSIPVAVIGAGLIGSTHIERALKQPWVALVGIADPSDKARRAAVEHQGFVLQPSFLVAPLLKSGALVEVLPQFRGVELGVYVVYPTRKHVPHKVRVLIDYLLEAFRTPAWPP